MNSCHTWPLPENALTRLLYVPMVYFPVMTLFSFSLYVLVSVSISHPALVQLLFVFVCIPVFWFLFLFLSWSRLLTDGPSSFPNTGRTLHMFSRGCLIYTPCGFAIR